MLQRIIFTILSILSLLSLSARELKVESFKLLPGDNSAKMYPRTDFNGDTCALVLFTTSLNNCQFENAIGEVEQKDGIYWVYLSPGTRRITLNNPDYERFTFDFSSVSDVIGVKSRYTYSSILSDKEDYSKPVDVMDDSYVRTLSVREFIPVLSDISARTRERRDVNNEKCAILRISLPLAGCQFDGIVGDPIYNLSEYLVYLSPFTKELVIRCPGLKPLKLDLKSLLNGDEIISSATYSLHLNGYNTALIQFTPQLISALKQFDDVESYSEGVFCVIKNGKKGRLSITGEIVVPANYEYIGPFVNGQAIVCKDSKYGIINSKGIEEISCQYDEKYKLEEQLNNEQKISSSQFFDAIVFENNGKSGFKKFDGSDYAESFEDDYAVVYNSNYSTLKTIGKGPGAIEEWIGGYGIINKSGKAVTSFEYSSIQPLKNFKYWVGTYDDIKGKKVYGILDISKSKIPELKYDSPLILEYSEGRAVVRKSQPGMSDKCGYINEDGNEIINCIYSWAYPFSNGIAVVENGDGKGIINEHGSLIVPFGKYAFFEFLPDGLIKVENNSKYGFIKSDGHEILPCIYDYVEPFSEGLALVKNYNGKYGYINTKGETVIPYNINSGSSFSEGVARVKKNMKWGFINHRGEEIIKCKYDIVGKFSGGLAEFELDGEYGFVNIRGEELFY